MSVILAENGAVSRSQRLVLATHNEGKVKELASVLSALGWDVVGMAQFNLDVPEENGGSFQANATIKAEAAALRTGLWALADDSGLEVDALGGAPGVDTAYFGGWQKLLEVMIHVPEELRSARFVCVLALVRTGLPTLYFKGVCEGTISAAALGDGGFGYDPVFIPSGHSQTFAQMTKSEKSAVSHRGLAIQQFKNWMQQ